MADRPRSTGSTLSHVTASTRTHVSDARSGGITPAHKSWTAYQGPMLYTGPSGLRDQRVNTQHDFQSTGENLNSSEITSQMSYLNRPPPGASFPLAKNGQDLPGHACEPETFNNTDLKRLHTDIAELPL